MKLSKIEKKIFALLHIGSIGSYFVIPWAWHGMTEAKTSFMSNLYGIPFFSCLSTILALLVFYYVIFLSSKDNKR
jgi:hypothetical protein